MLIAQTLFLLFRRINHDLHIDDSGPRKIDCGLKEIDAEKYKRNYEVRGKSVNNLNDSLAFKWNTSEVDKTLFGYIGCLFSFYLSDQGSVIHLASSSSSSSSDSEIDAEDIPDDIRITDSGVSSDTSNTNNSSDVRIEIVEEKLEKDCSQDDTSSINSRDEIEREKVLKMKMMFEEKIHTNKVSHSLINRAKTRPNSVVVPEVFKLDQSSTIQTNTNVCAPFPAPAIRKFSSVPTLNQPTKVTSSPRRGSSDSSTDSSDSDITPKREMENLDNFSDKFESEEETNADEFIHVRKTDDDFVKLRKRSEVGSLKNKFELLIEDNKARKSSFINWKSSNPNLQSRPISKTLTRSTPNLSSETRDYDLSRQNQEAETRRHSDVKSEDYVDEEEFQKSYHMVEETQDTFVHDTTLDPPPQFRDPQPEPSAGGKTNKNPAKITIPQHFVQDSVNRKIQHSSKLSRSPALARKSVSVLELRSMFTGENNKNKPEVKYLLSSPNKPTSLNKSLDLVVTGNLSKTILISN